MLKPNSRSINTYWTVNNDLMKGSRNLILVNGETEVLPGIAVVHTGGHNGGHQIVCMEAQEGKALHLADLLPTHAHVNPLWVIAYDNYPMDSIAMKERWITGGAVTEFGSRFIMMQRYPALRRGALAESFFSNDHISIQPSNLSRKGESVP